MSQIVWVAGRRRGGVHYNEKAVGLDGSSGTGVYTLDTASLSFTNQSFTIAGWVKLNAALNAYNFFSKYQYADNRREYLCRYLGSNFSSRWQFTVSPDGTTTNEHTINANNAGAASTGVWYFVCCYYDHGGNTINISINDGTVDSTAHTGISNQASNFTLGAYPDDRSQDRMNGAIDSVGVWRRKLSAADITWLYNGGVGRAYVDLDASMKTNLEAWWDLDEASGTREDAHGANDLTEGAGVSQVTGIR